MDTFRSSDGALRKSAGVAGEGGRFATERHGEQSTPLGASRTRRRSADELGIHPSVLMAPVGQQETFASLHSSLAPYRRSIEAAAAGREAGRYGYAKPDDALEISGEFFAESFKILTPEEIAPYWDRASHALQSSDEFELDRALLEASIAEEDAHPVRLDPNYKLPGVTLEEGFYESPRVVGNKTALLDDYNIATVNKHVRADIEEAKAAGFLPANLEVSVRKASGSVHMLVSSVPDEVKYVDDERYPGSKKLAPEVREIETRLETIAKQYGTFENDSQQDYFSNTFYISVGFK